MATSNDGRTPVDDAPGLIQQRSLASPEARCQRVDPHMPLSGHHPPRKRARQPWAQPVRVDWALAVSRSAACYPVDRDPSLRMCV